MHFRDDTYIEAGSRFSELPIRVPYGAEEYIKAIKDGIKATIEKEKKEGSDVKPIPKPSKPKASKIEEPKEKTSKPKVPKVEEPKEESSEELYKNIKRKYKELTKGGKDTKELLEIMKNNGTNAPSKTTDVTTLKKVLKALKEVK